MKLLLVAPIVLAAPIAILLVWRRADAHSAAESWRRLASASSAVPDRFEAALVADLPEPARRYFLFTIRPGARLRTVAVIAMRGEVGLGTKEDPKYQPMRAEQILAPPHGLVWKVRAGAGPMRIEGSDGIEGARSWVRFWLLGLVPVVRAGGGVDHLRAAFGRVVAEAAFWAPAALLPQNGVRWEAVDGSTARATVAHGGMSQTLDIRVDEEGRPLWVTIPRWTDANPEKVYRLQPFGGHVSDFREFDGFVLPTRVSGGNFFGTERYFPFYQATIETIRLTRDEPGAGGRVAR